MRRNVDVLMDRAPADAEAAARAAIAGIEPAVDLSRLRLRQAAGRHFADVVIAVPPGAAVGQGHAVADRVEAAVERALPGSDVVVHVEPRRARRRCASARTPPRSASPRVREIHNLSLVTLDGATELSLHLKLPGELPLEDAHEIAEEVERAIVAAVPEIDVGPDAPRAARGGERCRRARARARSSGSSAHATGTPPRAVRVLRTDEGLVAFLTLGLDPSSTLAEAHARASEVEERLRAEYPEIADVIVHTEP